MIDECGCKECVDGKGDTAVSAEIFSNLLNSVLGGRSAVGERGEWAVFVATGDADSDEIVRGDGCMEDAMAERGTSVICGGADGWDRLCSGVYGVSVGSSAEPSWGGAVGMRVETSISHVGCDTGSSLILVFFGAMPVTMGVGVLVRE